MSMAPRSSAKREMKLAHSARISRSTPWARAMRSSTIPRASPFRTGRTRAMDSGCRAMAFPSPTTSPLVSWRLGIITSSNPMPPPVQNVVPNASPINFHNDLAEGDDYGCFLRYETNGGTIDTLTVHDCTTGYKQQYCINITLQTANLYGTRSSDYGIFLPVESARGFVALNDNVSGYPVGFLLSEEYTQTITGGTWNNEINLEIPNNID